MSVHKLYRRDNQPFSQIPNEVIRNPKISNPGFRLMVYLMSHSDGYDLSYRQIEAQTGMKRHAIQNATKNLEELGLLSTELLKHDNGQFAGKAWIINDLTSAPNSTMESTAVESGVLIKNTNTKNINTKKDTFNDVEPVSRYSPDFERFWKNYPRREQKGDAFKAWEQLRKKRLLPSLDVLTVAAEAYGLRVTDPKFRKLPAGWLRAEMWLDEPVAPERPDPDAWMTHRTKAIWE